MMKHGVPFYFCNCNGRTIPAIKDSQNYVSMHWSKQCCEEQILTRAYHDLRLLEKYNRFFFHMMRNILKY